MYLLENTVMWVLLASWAQAVALLSHNT